MSEFEVKIELPNSQYGETLVINKYGDQFSLVAGGVGKNGNSYMKWCFPQGPDKQPREKAVPWGIRIGNKTDAVEVVKKIAAAFGLEIKP